MGGAVRYFGPLAHDRPEFIGGGTRLRPVNHVKHHTGTKGAAIGGAVAGRQAAPTVWPTVSWIAAIRSR
jgi:hypothetical protein